MRGTPETRISLGRYMRQEFSNMPLKICKVLFHQWLNIPSRELATLTNGYRALVVLPDLVANWTYLRGDFELEVTNFIYMVAAKGMLALDIGAQFGVKSGFLKDAVGEQGKVIAFEPIPSTYSILQINAANWNVETHKLAISNRSCFQKMWDFGPRNSGQNTLKKPHYSRSLSGKYISVETISIDRFIQNSGLRTDLWKIDTENAEFDVLSGGVLTISNQKPEIIMEVGDLGRASGEQTGDCLKLLSEKGYAFYEITNGRLNLIKNGLPSSKTTNILASQKKF